MKQDSIRHCLLQRLARKCLSVDGDRVIIAIDGVDGAGKTTFADELAAKIMGLGGRHSPQGYFLDSYDYNALNGSLLLPFRAGVRFVETARFDHRSDRQITSWSSELATNSILVLDGIFLHPGEWPLEMNLLPILKHREIVDIWKDSASIWRGAIRMHVQTLSSTMLMWTLPRSSEQGSCIRSIPPMPCLSVA